MTNAGGEPIHAFLVVDDRNDSLRLVRARRGELDDVELSSSLAAFIREHSRAGDRLLPFLGESDVPLVLAVAPDGDRFRTLTAHGDRPISGCVSLFSSSCAAAVGPDGAPFAVVSGTLTGGRDAVVVRTTGIQTVEVLPDGLRDRIGADWGQRLALARLGGDPHTYELIAARGGDTNGRGRVWRHRLVLHATPHATLVETLDAYGRWHLPGPDQL